MKNIKTNHILMFIIFALPCWIFSALIRFGLIKSLNISVWQIAALQTIPLVSWWIYVSILPSIIGQIRLALNTEKEKPSETVSIGVTTRAAFLAMSIAGIALIGLQVIKEPKEFSSLNHFSISFFIFSFIAFTISTDISDSAKNIPFRVTGNGVILTRRGARYYQYGLTYLVCGFATVTANIGEIFGFIFIIIWNIMYILANLPTKKFSSSLNNKLKIVLISTLVILLPIFILNPVLNFGVWQSIIFIIYILFLISWVSIIINQYKENSLL